MNSPVPQMPALLLWALSVLRVEALVQTEGLMRALTEVEMPLVHALQQMEAVGIAVDITIFEKHKVRSWPSCKADRHGCRSVCTQYVRVTCTVSESAICSTLLPLVSLRITPPWLGL